MIEIRSLTAAEVGQYRRALAAILVDCVEGGASVSFMSPFSEKEAEACFEKITPEVEDAQRIIFAAFEGSELLGTVQLCMAMPPNQRHRADVSKLLVRQSARGRGIARLLMEALEDCARSLGKALLVLDTATGSAAERLYLRMGWTKAGVVPGYAKFPSGELGDTTIFFKALK
jgi:GNAT superfamily N-acetyltransferase